MKKLLLSAAVALAAVAPLSATAQQGTSFLDNLPVVQVPSIQSLADAWTTAYNRQDATALGLLYSETAHLYLDNRPRIEGRQAIQEFWAADMGVGSPLTVLTVTDEVQGVDTRLVHGNFQVINRETGVVLAAGRFAHTWLLIGDTWLLDRDHWVARSG